MKLTHVFVTRECRGMADRSPVVFVFTTREKALAHAALKGYTMSFMGTHVMCGEKGQEYIDISREPLDISPSTV